MFFAYTKKEDVRDVPKAQKTYAAIVFIASAIALGIIQFSVVPKLFKLYASLELALPPSAQLLTYLCRFLMMFELGAGIYLLFAKPNYTKVDALAKKYKRGEMIKTRALMDQKLEWLPILFGFIGVSFIFVGVIFPIYSLTSRL